MCQLEEEGTGMCVCTCVLIYTHNSILQHKAPDEGGGWKLHLGGSDRPFHLRCAHTPNQPRKSGPWWLRSVNVCSTKSPAPTVFSQSRPREPAGPRPLWWMHPFFSSICTLPLPPGPGVGFCPVAAQISHPPLCYLPARSCGFLPHCPSPGGGPAWSPALGSAFRRVTADPPSSPRIPGHNPWPTRLCRKSLPAKNMLF